MRILIVQTAFIGDVILATSLIETLAQHQPDAEISVLVRKGNQGLLENNPWIKEVLIWDKKGDKWGSLKRLLKHIRAERFDQLINLQRFGTTGYLTWRSKAKVKIGFSKNPFSFAFDIKKEHEVGKKTDQKFTHEIERNATLIDHLIDDPVNLQNPRLYPSKEDHSAIAPYTKSEFVTMAPSSVWFTKQLPKEKWNELIAGQTSHVYLLGGPDDRELCEEIRNSSSPENVTNLAGELSFLKSAALMTKARMNFVNDSAPLHIASAMNAPVTAFFCSTIPQFGFGPLAADSRIIQVDQDLDCRPCGLHGHAACPKGHFKCANDIQVRGL